MRSRLRPSFAIRQVALVTSLLLIAHGPLAVGVSAQSVSESEVEQRTVQAVQAAGTYRATSYDVNSGGIEGGNIQSIFEVNLAQGTRVLDGDRTLLRVDTGGMSYVNTDRDDEWTIIECEECDDGFFLGNFINQVTEPSDFPRWFLVGTESVNGREAYKLVEVYANETDKGTFLGEQTLWIDVSSFLPIKFESLGYYAETGVPNFHNEGTFSDFGANITIEVPQEALQ